MPRSPTSDYITAYAAERGIPKRTAQDRFKKRHSDVMDWLVRAGIKLHDPRHEPRPIEARALVDRLERPEGSPFADALAGGTTPQPLALQKEESTRTVEEHAECEAWLMFVANSAATRHAAKSNDIAAAGFARTAMECFKQYQIARNDRIKADIDARRLLPISEYEALIGDISKIVSAWSALGPELAKELDPANPSRVLRLFENFQQTRLNPIVQAILAA